MADPHTVFPRGNAGGEDARVHHGSMTIRDVAACLLGGISILASGCASTPELAASHPWLEVTTPHFLIRSEVDAEQTKEIAQRLEVFRTAVRRLAGIQKQLRPARARVYVFRNKRSFGPYNPQGQTTHGYFFQAPYAPHFALTVGADSDLTFRVIYHEYVHQMLREAGLEFPLWYEEGFSEILASFRIEAGRAQVGLPLRDRLAELRAGNWKSDASLLEQMPCTCRKSELPPGFHAQAWALAHFFIFESPRRLKQLERYLEHWRRGEPPREAFERVFDTPYDAFWIEATAHLKEEEIAFGDFPVSAGETNDISARALSRAESLTALGNLLRQVGGEGSCKKPADFFYEALQANPNLPTAYSGLSVFFDAAGEAQKARKLLTEAQRQAPRNLEIRVLSGDHSFRRFDDASEPLEPAWPATDPGDLGEARWQYSFALRLRPDSAAIAQRLGMTYLFDSKRSEGIALLQRARKSWPHHRGIAETLARLYVQQGDDRSARRTLADALRADANSPAVSSWLSDIVRSPSESLTFDQLLHRINSRSPTGQVAGWR